jgi:hypothetical protein
VRHKRQDEQHDLAISPEKKTWLLAIQNVFLAREGIAAYTPITILVFIMFCAASWEVFLPITDPARYQCYALTFWLGGNATTLLPAQQCAFLQGVHSPFAFHMLPIEYPPLTLLPFSLALFAPLPYYQLAFALIMALVVVFVHWLLLRYGPRGAGLIFTLYLLGGAVATAQVRFDLIPAALTLLCLIAAERRAWTTAYIALALGVLFKLYPILLFPALFIAEQQSEARLPLPAHVQTRRALLTQLWKALHTYRRWQWRNTVIFFALCIGVTAFFAMLNFQEAVVTQVSYFLHRPVQIESLQSSLLWLITKSGIPFHVDYIYGSLNFRTPIENAVSLPSFLCFALGSVYTLYLQWRGRIDITQASIALLLVFIATGKVFSPQYAIWLIPLLAYAGAFDLFWVLIWGPVAIFTTVIFAYFYTRPVPQLSVPMTPGFFQIIAIRNLLFLLIALAYLFNWFSIRHRRSLPPPVTGKETRPLVTHVPLASLPYSQE